MVALRKDVKVGLTIGAIAVSVIGVYAGLSALASEKPAADASTASLAVSPMDGKRVEAAKPAVSDRSAARNDQRAAPTDGAAGTASAAGNTGSAATPPAEANPIAPVTARTGGEDPWAVAFGTGVIQPKKTVTPTPGKPADVAADRAATINSINGDPKTQTANAGDTSGSITAGTTPELTRIAEQGGAAAPTTPAPAAPVATGPEKSHTVEPGETFTSIASEYYGDGKYYNQILTANPQVNPNRLKPGTVIKIPALAKKEPMSDTAELPATGAAAIDATKQYVVKPGDSLHKIASSLWNDSAQAGKLYELNKTTIGTDPTKLKPGMVLTLPATPTQTARR